MSARPLSPAGLMAQSLFNSLLEKISSMDRSLIRLLELAEMPREMLMAAGSQPFGGTVGVTPASCTIAPAAGESPGVILPANPHRRGLTIVNTSASGATQLTIGLGIRQPQAGVGIVLLGNGGAWDGRISGAVWMGAVAVVSNVAGCTFGGVETLGPNERRRPQNVPL